MAVFWNKSVPIPKVKGITINRSDGNRVLFVKEAPYDAKVGYARPKRITIGYVNNKDVKAMHPTSGYKEIFPSEWEKIFGEKVPSIIKYIGMYVMAEAVNSNTGIKDIMDECLNTQDPGAADAMIDLSMYSMLYQSSVVEHFSSKMKDQMLFSGSGRSDSYYSDLFGKKISYEQILSFKKKWALKCTEEGVEKVWLCIDGSNDDCESTGVEFSEKGHAKSLRNRKIISFTYAVTEDGKPVTFEVYRGALVDAKAMKRIIKFLKECGIQVKGVILDRGYCDTAALKFLNNEGLEYVIMVKGKPAGYTEIVDDYGKKIKLNAEYLIRDTTLFAVQKKVQLFDNYKHDDYLTLFYDYKNGSDRITTMLKKLYDEISRCENELKEGKIPSVSAQFKEAVKVSDDLSGMEIVTEKLQEMLDEKGLYSIVSSKEMTPAEIHHLYQCRNSSETEYMILKTQLGYGKVRVRTPRRVQVKFLNAFITTCIRYELQNISKELGKTTNEVIQELNRLYITKVGESYVPIQGIIGKQELILKLLNTSESILSEIAKDENDRLAGRKPVPRHRKTGPNTKQTVVLEPKAEKKQPVKKKKAGGKPGVKPGTKRPDINKDGTPRRKPGVPKGTKRSDTNKNGSPRKKPGPKVKEDAPVTTSG